MASIALIFMFSVTTPSYNSFGFWSKILISLLVMFLNQIFRQPVVFSCTFISRLLPVQFNYVNGHITKIVLFPTIC